MSSKDTSNLIMKASVIVVCYASDVPTLSLKVRHCIPVTHAWSVSVVTNMWVTGWHRNVHGTDNGNIKTTQIMRKCFTKDAR